MKIVLISMPDITPILIHETAVHMPNLGIASIAANIEAPHEVLLIDLVRKRRRINRYLTKTLGRLQPEVVGLSAMTWQYDTCVKIAQLIKTLLPKAKLVLGGYHATLMYREIVDSPAASLFDFIVRGEGEEVCRRLINALAGQDRLTKIAGLSHREDGTWTHNPDQPLLDLATLKRPLRDRRRLTWGYHLLYSKIEVLETSRGCTRACRFCSMQYMYGRRFRTFPIRRIIEDLDDIYHQRRTRWVFVVDDNMVLNPRRVMDLCEAIIARGYKGLNLMVQADCVSICENEPMVEKMAQAGFRTVFLGIENSSRRNLATMAKQTTLEMSKRAVRICQEQGLMVIGGLIFGFPDDDQAAIQQNYEFFKDCGADAAYCQILTPYPKTGLREDLMQDGHVTNPGDYTRYNGLWANVRTKHLDAQQLQYYFWYYRQTVLGWWRPSARAQRNGRLWTAIWRFVFKPFLQIHLRRVTRREGWRGRHQRELVRLEKMNTFVDLPSGPADFQPESNTGPVG